MIQSINNSLGTNRKSFGQKAPARLVDYRSEEIRVKQAKAQKRKAIAKHLGFEFFAGAIITTIVNGTMGLFDAVGALKQGKTVKDIVRNISMKNLALNAMKWGFIWMLIDAAFLGLASAMNSKKHK